MTDNQPATYAVSVDAHTPACPEGYSVLIAVEAVAPPTEREISEAVAAELGYAPGDVIITVLA